MGWQKVYRFLTDLTGDLHRELFFEVRLAVINGLGLQIILETAKPPVAEVVFVQVFACFTQFFDDDFVRKAVVDHAVDLVAKRHA